MDEDGCVGGGCGCLLLLIGIFVVLPFALKIIMAVCGFLLGILG